MGLTRGSGGQYTSQNCVSSIWGGIRACSDPVIVNIVVNVNVDGVALTAPTHCQSLLF